MLIKSILFCLIINPARGNLENYWKTREEIVKRETNLMLGSSITLNSNESIVNELLMKIKLLEYDHENESNFLPRRHFFNSKSSIEKSYIFQLIQDLPKGASLHTHLTASVSFEYLFYNLTYEENLYGCILNDKLKLKFFTQNNQSDLCRWELIKNLRSENASYNDWLKQQLTLFVENPREIYNNADVVWAKFRGIFSTIYDFISYKAIYERYIYQALLELYSDRIFYVEFRAIPMQLYELNGTTYGVDDFFKITLKAIDTFKADHPSFLGAKFIYSPSRTINTTKTEEYIKDFQKYSNKYPNFIIGFDFVGFEEKGHALKYFVPLLLNVTNEVKYFFHAGETNWFGTDVDLNLLDAILLNSTRIGHAYAIVKHPVISKLLRDKDIAVEISPISNQVLMLVDDLRNHPGNVLISNGYPVVVCNDDPGFWGTTGLSYDWYLAFMGLSSKSSNLKCFKQLAINSIKYSGMSDKEKETALKIWNESWNAVIDQLVASIL